MYSVTMLPEFDNKLRDPITLNLKKKEIKLVILNVKNINKIVSK